jgi:hypothetical protein
MAFSLLMLFGFDRSRRLSPFPIRVHIITIKEIIVSNTLVLTRTFVKFFDDPLKEGRFAASGKNACPSLVGFRQGGLFRHFSNKGNTCSSAIHANHSPKAILPDLNRAHLSLSRLV